METWKRSWGYVPITYGTEAGVLENVTQHAVLENNLAGNKVRIKFSNRENDQALCMECVEIATKNNITGVLSEKAYVTRKGNKQIVLQPGEECYSDEINMKVTWMDHFELFSYFKERNVVKTICVTWSPDSWKSFLTRGNTENGEEVSYQTAYPLLANDIYACQAIAGFCAVDVYSDEDVKTVALFGDSITHMSYYSAPLTKMLYRRMPGKITVLNVGIGGNRLIADAPYVEDAPGNGKLFGKAGVKRFEQDIYEDIVPDLLFCMEGVNDCTHSFAFSEEKKPTGKELWNGLESMIAIAHEKGSKVLISTVMPFGCEKECWKNQAEEIRQDFNGRIRKQTSADGLIDLDKIVRNEEQIDRMKEGLSLGDGVHPNQKGGRMIAEALLLPVMEEELDFYGEEAKTIPIFENPVDYPADILAEMVRLAFAVRSCQDAGKKHELEKKYISLRDALELSYEVKAPILLWDKGNMPTCTEYTENFDHRYAHDPDFEPFLLEVLLPETVNPKGAVLTIAGGEHGMNTVSECYQICKDFNEKGYQGFIVNARPNHGPWSGKEAGVDAARAVRYVRAHADQYRIEPDQIALAGFSNGGVATEQCIQYCSGDQTVKEYFPNYKPDGLDAYAGGPDVQLCVYGPRHLGTGFDYSRVVYPPTFYAIGMEDHVAVANMNAVYADLMARGVTVEVHTFSGHPHGYAGWKIIDGKGDPNFDLWEDLADHFMQDIYRKNNVYKN